MAILSEKAPQFFFCIGPPKTGTTLLARMLDQHPSIACLFESYSLYPDSPSSLFHEKSKKWQKHGFTRSELRSWSDTWGKLSANVTRVEDWQGLERAREQTFEALLPGVMQEFSRRTGASVVGDKWCWYIPALAVVRRVFPTAKFLYTVRDPRAVWHSGERFLDRGRGDQTLAEQLAQDRKVAVHLSEKNFHIVKYEELVLNNEDTLRKIHQFLCVAPLGGRFRSRPLEQDPYPQRWDWVPEANTPLDPAHIHKWRDQLSVAQIRQVNDKSAEFMACYGYDLEPTSGCELAKPE